MANESLKANIADFFERVANKSLFNQLKSFDIFGAVKPELQDREFDQENGVTLHYRVLAEPPRLTYAEVVDTTDYTEAYYGSVLLAHDAVWDREFEDRLGHGAIKRFLEPVWHGLAVAPAFGGNKYGALAAKIQCRVQLLRSLKALAEKEGLVYDWPTEDQMTFNTDAFSNVGVKTIGLLSSDVPRSPWVEEHGSKLDHGKKFI